MHRYVLASQHQHRNGKFNVRIAPKSTISKWSKGAIIKVWARSLQREKQHIPLEVSNFSSIGGVLLP